MAAFRSAWCIGSYASLPVQDVTIAGSAETVDVGSGAYLYDGTAQLSLLAHVQTAMTAAGVAGASAVLLGSRKVRLSGGGVFAVTWTDTLLRDLLGFSANLAGAASYTAPLISPLLWSPGKPETPQLAPIGVVGHPAYATYQAVAPYSGRTESVSHGSRLYNRFTWGLVDAERVRTADDLGGEFGRFFAQVAVTSSRFKLYRDVLEDPAGTSPVTSSLDEPLGPYVYTADRRGGWKYDRSRGFDWTDAACDVEMPVHVVQEYA
jgi:hypothetical protein